MNNKIALRFGQVTNELWNMIYSKSTLYGWSRFDPHSDMFNYWMCFSDIHRKTLRLEELTSIAAGEMDEELTRKEWEEARDKLIDDYKDIANYAIMAVMILEEKQDGV